jgi:two-component system sensor histidine kinase KdpD
MPRHVQLRRHPSGAAQPVSPSNLSRIVLGRDTGRWPRPWRVTLAEAVGVLGNDLDVIQIALPARKPGKRRPDPVPAEESQAAPGGPPAWRAYLMSAATCGVVALLAAPLHSVFELSNIVMMFLLAVVFVAVRFGRGPAVLAAFLSVAAFDFLYVPPRYTFSVNDAQYLVTFAVMLVVALVIGQLTAGLKFQAQVATLRRERVSALYEMSRDLSGALMAEQIAEIAARFLQSEFEARAALLVADLDNRLNPPVPLPDLPDGIDQGVAQWAYDHAEAAGHGTNTLPASPMLYLPLKAPMRMRGVLTIEPKNPARLAGPEQRRLLDTCASLLAISLERIHYVDVAQSTTLQMESERLRNSLLAAISHDLRTPLAALVGMAESMTMTQPPPTGQQAKIADAIREAALRMSALVNNLLDMARLQSGQVQLNRQWLPLEEVIGTALKALGPSIDSRRVRVSLPADLPLLHIDAVLMERVLWNLLENAVKYTPPESLIVINAVTSSASVKVMVDDHGPGLPKNREESIFQMFERGRKESATGGVGLGLAICRAIVEAHGGTIWGETRPDGGARFTFELPRGEPPQMAGVEDDKLETGTS